MGPPPFGLLEELVLVFREPRFLKSRVLHMLPAGRRSHCFWRAITRDIKKSRARIRFCTSEGNA